MPNTPVAVGEGYYLCFIPEANQTDEDLLHDFSVFGWPFGQIRGKTVGCSDSSCWLWTSFRLSLYRRLWRVLGVRAGLGRDISLELANQTLLGAAKLSQVSGQHQAQLKKTKSVVRLVRPSLG